MSLDKKMKELREDGIGVDKVSCNKFMDEMKSGKQICKNARLMTDRVQAKYSCGCSHIVFIQPDNVNQQMNVEVPFVCKNCPKGVPIQLTIYKTKYSIKNLKQGHRDISGHPANCQCTGVAVGFPLHQFETVIRGE